MQRREVDAARILVTFLEIEDDEETATPDDSKLGLRVARRVLCALSPDDPAREYKVTVVGLASNVQWMIKAHGETSFFLTVANGRSSGATLTFNVLSHMETTEIGFKPFQRHVEALIGAVERDPVIFLPTDTPLKRQRVVDAAEATEGGEQASFAKRRLASN